MLLSRLIGHRGRTASYPTAPAQIPSLAPSAGFTLSTVEGLKAGLKIWFRASAQDKSGVAERATTPPTMAGPSSHL